MSTNQNTQQPEEIDLGYLFKKVNDFIKSVFRSFFLVLAFFKKYFIIVILLIIVGFAYGYYKDSTAEKTYNNELIVIPNFESVDYLYDKVKAVNQKISAGDTIYMKQILGANFKRLKNIKIEPIVDLYNFLSKSRANIDIFSILSEKQDFTDYVEEFANSKYYKYHRMSVSIESNDSSEKVVSDLIKFLNDNDHFSAYEKIFKETKDFEIKEYYKILTQIDTLIKASATFNSAPSSIEVVTNNDQHELIDKKRQVLANLVILKTAQLDYTKPIKLINADYNLTNERFLSFSNKVRYPVLLVFLFSAFFFFLHLIKNLRRYANSE
jgi:uncharacterized membrane protein